MNIIDFFTVHFNNFKKNLFNLSKKDKINNLKINIIINNIIKIGENNDSNFLNSEGDFKYRNKRGGRFYN